MEKIIKIGDREFSVKSTAASLFRYKNNFNRDGLQDLMRLAKSMPKGKEIGDDFELDVFYRFLWTFAKAADNNIKPMIDWLDGFEILPIDFISEALPQVQDLLISSVQSNVKSKN